MTRKEFLVVVCFCNHFRHVEVEEQRAGWLGELSQFTMNVIHRPEKVYGNADSMSLHPHTGECSNFQSVKDIHLLPCGGENTVREHRGIGANLRKRLMMWLIFLQLHKSGQSRCHDSTGLDIVYPFPQFPKRWLGQQCIWRIDLGRVQIHCQSWLLLRQRWSRSIARWIRQKRKKKLS